MYKFLLIACFLGLSATDCQYKENYCDPSLCPPGVEHIACNNSGQFEDSCPADRKLIHLTTAEIESMVNIHNTLRNKIASGDEVGFLPASRMATMTWNPKLARLAQLNVKQCTISHDPCHTTSKYLFAGQNLGLRAQTGFFEPVDSFIENVIQSWYDEVKDASQSDIDNCCESASGQEIGHFTLMVTDRATQVGCAVATYTNGKWKTSLMACNYSFTNLEGANVYLSGTTASGCTTGVNADFPALCSVYEPIEATP